MTTDIYESDERMKILLKESEFAFSILMEEGGTPNSDYADYTSNHFINSFRHIMQKPDLSRAQLASMLRAAERRKKRRKNDHNWAGFMSQIIANGAANTSDRTIN